MTNDEKLVLKMTSSVLGLLADISDAHGLPEAELLDRTRRLATEGRAIAANLRQRAGRSPELDCALDMLEKELHRLSPEHYS